MPSQLIFSDPAVEMSEELSAGEKLLWSGRPRQGIFLRSNDIFLIPFSLMWGGFAIFWELSVLGLNPGIKSANSPPVFFALWGIPFVALGLYIMFGRFFVDVAQRSKTAYGVTNQRVIIRSGIFSQDTKSLNLRTLSDVTLSEKRDGSGTITLGPSVGYYSWFAGAAWPGMSRRLPPRFDNIPDAKRVYDLIR